MADEFFQTTQDEDFRIVGTLTIIPLREKFERIKMRARDALWRLLQRPHDGRVEVITPDAVLSDEQLEELAKLARTQKLAMRIIVHVMNEREAETVRLEGQRAVADALRKHNSWKWSVALELVPSSEYLRVILFEREEREKFERVERARREHASFLERLAAKTKAWESPER
jgi:hypothetical protein